MSDTPTAKPCTCPLGTCLKLDLADRTGKDPDAYELTYGRTCRHALAQADEVHTIPEPPEGCVDWSTAVLLGYDPPEGAILSEKAKLCLLDRRGGAGVPTLPEEEDVVVDPSMTIAEAERAERERQEDKLRQKAGEVPDTPAYGDDFNPSGAINVWIGFDDEGRQQIRYKWDASVTNTTVLGVCEYLKTLITNTMLQGLEETE